MCVYSSFCSSLIQMPETPQTSVLQRCLLLLSDYEEDFHLGIYTADDIWVWWIRWHSSHGTFTVEGRRQIRPRYSTPPIFSLRLGSSRRVGKEERNKHVQKCLGLANFPVISGFRTSWSRFLSGKSCLVTAVDLLSINLFLFTSMYIFYLHEILWLWAL